MKRRQWPLLLIATPAAVAIWSGWVGLGQLCGFGVVNLLPGIGGGFHLNTAITLPVGVEAYAAFALGAWMGSTSGQARTFAKWSALGALGYGMLGQVVYHLLAAAHVTAAPWPIVVMVSCMPVMVLGFAAALTHLLREAGQPQTGRGGDPSSPPSAAPAAVSSDAVEAAKARMRQADRFGFKYSNEQAAGEWRLTRAEVTKARREVTENSPAGVTSTSALGTPAGVIPSSNGHGGAHA